MSLTGIEAYHWQTSREASCEALTVLASTGAGRYHFMPAAMAPDP